uniref:PLAC8 like 1 n=1 Tax=Maylandia zebra TaxID=106582 RepID=A0A3P9B120_9CICH
MEDATVTHDAEPLVNIPLTSALQDEEGEKVGVFTAPSTSVLQEEEGEKVGVFTAPSTSVLQEEEGEKVGVFTAPSTSVLQEEEGEEVGVLTTDSAIAFQEKEVGRVTTGSEDNWGSNKAPAALEPVVTQPGLGITKTTITTITQTGGDWSTGLLDVCRDKTTCILGALVPCCLDLSLAHQYGECLCMPLLPGSTFAIRVGIRERYKIRVSVCLCVCRYTVCCTVVRASLKTEEGKFVKMDPVHNTIKFSMKQKLHHRTQFLVL